MALATCVATILEKRRPLRIDAMIPNALFTSTHAITIDAPPEQVWPWVAQMGAGRAGWYSWDAIDNGGIPSASRLVPDLQMVVPGDIMPTVPGATDAFIVFAVEPPRDLVLTVPDGHGGHAVAWEHALFPLDGGRTRLMVRGRASSDWLDLARAKPGSGHRRIFIERAYAALARLPRPLLIGFAAFGHRIMEARHLRGIQRRSTASGHGASTEGLLKLKDGLCVRCNKAVGALDRPVHPPFMARKRPLARAVFVIRRMGAVAKCVTSLRQNRRGEGPSRRTSSFA